MDKNEAEFVKVTLACGHEVKYFFYGTKVAREAALDRLVNSTPVCRACRLEEQRRQAEARAKETLKELGGLKFKFPALIASTQTPWGTPLSREDQRAQIERGRRGRDHYISGHEDWATLNDPEVIYGIVDEVQDQFAVDFWRHLDQATNALSQHKVPTSLKRYAIERRPQARFWSSPTPASQIELIYEWAYDLAARGEAEAAQK